MYMYAYIKGMVTDIESTYIVVDHQGLGFMVYTPNPYSFELNKRSDGLFISIYSRR